MFDLTDPLKGIAAEIDAGRRITPDEALALAEQAPLALLGLLAILAILTGLAGKRVAVVLLRLRGRIERIAVALRLRVIGVVGIAVALLAL